MRTYLAALAACALTASPALADAWKDESRKGWRGYEFGDWSEREYKRKYRTADGCEVKRKWKKGKYEEKVKCKPGKYGYRD